MALIESQRAVVVDVHAAGGGAEIEDPAVGADGELVREVCAGPQDQPGGDWILAKVADAQGVDKASSGRDVRQQLLAGNVDTMRLTHEAGQRLGEVMATVVCLLNPAVLLIALTSGLQP